MKIIKQPLEENDSMHFVLSIKDLDSVAIDDIDYFKAKDRMFQEQIINKAILMPFKDRPSLRGIDCASMLVGTCYTYGAIKKNDATLEQMFGAIRTHKNTSRRCVIRMVDSLRDYLDDSIDTSCLNIIHYLSDRVVLFFRASDMRYELSYDLILIKKHFIDPVYGGELKHIEVIASTTQNIGNLKHLFI